ncbi:MAG: hypothetical protein N2110_04355 [Flavobacteriales bacterium]|nr:hypothetical protein [Flavobacteriales bacterium]
MWGVVLFYMSLVLCASLTGVFWFMHVAYYPAFRYIAPDLWGQFFKKRFQNTSMVVYPMMAFETLAALALFFMMLRYRVSGSYTAATFLLFGIWAWNLLFLNRRMKSLEQNPSPTNFRDLEKASLVRATGYTLRLFLLVGGLIGS